MVARNTKRTLGVVGAGAVLALAVASTSVAQPRTPTTSSTAKDAGSEAGPAVTPEPPDHAAIVVILDGARWQDVLLGIDPALARRAKMDPRSANVPVMPHLAELARTRGAVLGTPGTESTMRVTGPNFVSLPGYAELFSGRGPTRACSSNKSCEPAASATIADLVRQESDSPRDVAVFASWSELVKVASTDPSSMVVSAGRTLRRQEAALRADAEESYWLDRGERANAWPGDGDYRPDRFTAPLAVRYLEAARPRFLFLSLGDADEHAHHGDYPSYLGALHDADETIAAIVRALDRMGARGKNTTLFVTADHGRSFDFRDHGGKWPESARTWLVAIGDAVRARGPVQVPGDHRLADVAPTLRAWLGIPADDAPTAGAPITELLGWEGPRPESRF